MTGIVKMIHDEKLFGFIKSDTGEDFFFHRSFTPEFDRLVKNDKVDFESEKGPKGMRAINVTRRAV